MLGVFDFVHLADNKFLVALAALNGLAANYLVVLKGGVAVRAVEMIHDLRALGWAKAASYR